VKRDPRWRDPPQQGGKQPRLPAGGQLKKEVRTSPAESTDRLTPAWQFSRVDRDHRDWGWDKLGPDGLHALLHDELSKLETMTWAEIQAASGGRRNGNNSHFVTVSDCCKAARDRLEELRMDDTDEVFSLRLTGRLRLYGIRDGRVLRFIWHDPDHSVYPTSR